jgi:hypothetical protein
MYKNHKVVTELVVACRNKDITLPFINGVTENPIWERIECAIDNVFNYAGGVRLGVEEPKNSIVKRLSIEANPGKYRLYALMRSINTGKRLYVWWEAEDKEYRGDILIDDDEWDARSVCTDISIAKNYFYNIFESGDLREDYLSQMRLA